jgi:hypothetical protein
MVSFIQIFRTKLTISNLPIRVTCRVHLTLLYFNIPVWRVQIVNYTNYSSLLLLALSQALTVFSASCSQIFTVYVLSLMWEGEVFLPLSNNQKHAYEIMRFICVLAPAPMSTLNSQFPLKGYPKSMSYLVWQICSMAIFTLKHSQWSDGVVSGFEVYSIVQQDVRNYLRCMTKGTERRCGTVLLG